jgi:hypothetical protein
MDSSVPNLSGDTGNTFIKLLSPVSSSSPHMGEEIMPSFGKLDVEQIFGEGGPQRGPP